MSDLTLPQLEPIALPDDARRLLERIGCAEPSPAMRSAIAHGWTYSPYLRSLMRLGRPAFAAMLHDGPDAAVVDVYSRLSAEEPAASARMRQAKADVALITAIADLAGLWPLEKVTAALSQLADHTLDLAVRTAIAERMPGAPAEGFTVLALGKLGSGELNYSSDVDLILLHDRSRMPRRDRDDPDEAALRVARRVVELMQGRDADGYVFRVDLRLRPSPEATPITLPIEAAESYYHSEALPWERAAFIRARACAGDIALGNEFLNTIRPFVWRRSLDYSAIRDIQSISLRIRDHFEGGQKVGPGYDLKRGRGGIREIEFFAQIHQMIFGGREPALRAPATLDALRALADADRVTRDDAEQLSGAYRFFRTLEHRIQMRADEQTHAVPVPAAARTSLAQVSGLDGWRTLERMLGSASRRVASSYDTLIAKAGGKHLPRDLDALLHDLKKRRLSDTDELARLITVWRGGRYRALRTADAQHAFEQLLPELLDTIRTLPDQRAAAGRLDTFLASLPAGVQFFMFLNSNPQLVGLLGRLFGTTPVLADALARKPDLFDVLLDPHAFEPLPRGPELVDELRAFVGGGVRQMEDVLDRVRRWTAERRFQIGVQLVEGLADPLDAAAGYAGLADAALQALAPTVAAAFAETHGKVEGGELVILGLGRYGGRSLTVRSDLDLVYLFSGSHMTQSDGAKPLAATTYFNRLAQRLSAALSVPTAEGALYEVDTRLRPSGAQGLLAVTTDTFAQYQREEAWTWEHMALTRARVVLGEPAARSQVEAIIAGVLDTPRDPDKLRGDVIAMRDEMAQHKPGHGLWDVKLGRGGLVDLEFIIHYLQLRERAAFTPDLQAACEGLIARGLIPDALLDAHDLMTRLLVVLRLVVPDTSGRIDKVPSEVRALLARATRQPDFDALEAALKLAKAAVTEAWDATFESTRRGK